MGTGYQPTQGGLPVKVRKAPKTLQVDAPLKALSILFISSPALATICDYFLNHLL